MTLQEHISTLFDNPQANIDPQWVEEMCNRFPFFSFPALMMLKQGVEISSQERDKMTHWLALNVSDRDILSRFIDVESDYWTHFYPEEKKKSAISTNDAIETFLDNYGGNNPKEDEMLERLIFNPTPDYAQILAEEEERSVPQNVDLSDNSQDALINAFILKSREQQGHYPAINEELALESKKAEESVEDNTPIMVPDEAVDDSMFSESLAKIYIKQRKYSKAYEIIRNLSLNFPEKSIYFADQLRFLQKLIINQRYIQSKNNLN